MVQNVLHPIRRTCDKQGGGGGEAALDFADFSLTRVSQEIRGWNLKKEHFVRARFHTRHAIPRKHKSKKNKTESNVKNSVANPDSMSRSKYQLPTSAKSTHHFDVNLDLAFYFDRLFTVKQKNA